ncbi:hypothetical protein BDY24DRAFT_438059 [Mrakia frigida]|uniref:DNA-directed RNA polymerase I subunit RPA43 n=1 Tax=Mrakia frigida TaxID=29902 RepID=UPI003FCC0776
MSTSHSKPPKVKKSKKSKPSSVVAVASGSASASPFTHITTTMRVSVPPYFSGSQGGGLRGGVEELLDSMVMRYIPTLSGVLLSHSNHTFPSDSANILNDCPFAITDVSFDAIIWAPQVGQTLVGTHSLSSPSHISLLIHKTFNVSIPLPHIPTDLYYFDSALADTPPPLSPSPSPEPEAAPIAPTEADMEVDEDADEAKLDVEDEEEEDLQAVEERRRAKEEAERIRKEEKEERRAEKERNEFSSGRWRSKMSGKVLGEEGEEVEFTVVAMTISSQMLSLTGSLLPLPFSIPAFPNNPHQLSENPLDPSPAKKSKKSKKSADDALPLDNSDAEAEPEVDEKEMSLQRAERKKARKLEKEELKRKRGEEGGEVEGEGGEEKKVKKSKKSKA